MMSDYSAMMIGEKSGRARDPKSSGDVRRLWMLRPASSGESSASTAIPLFLDRRTGTTRRLPRKLPGPGPAASSAGRPLPSLAATADGPAVANGQRGNERRISAMNVDASFIPAPPASPLDISNMPAPLLDIPHHFTEELVQFQLQLWITLPLC